MPRKPAAASSDAPAEETASEAEPTVALKLSVVEKIKELLHASEWSGPADAGGAKCPVCKASQPLDPANVRPHEQHTEDCALGQALAALK